MKRTIVIIISAFLMMNGLFISKAEAMTDCRSTGTFASYGWGDVIVIDPGTPNEFYEFRCKQNGMRVYKVKANTTSEYAYLKDFAKKYSKARHHNIAFCPIHPGRANLVDLSYWYYASIKSISKNEKANYDSWLKDYADRNDCKIFN